MLEFFKGNLCCIPPCHSEGTRVMSKHHQAFVLKFSRGHNVKIDMELKDTPGTQNMVILF